MKLKDIGGESNMDTVDKYLGEAKGNFKVTVEKNVSDYGSQKPNKNKVLDQKEFSDKKEAMAFKKEMIKKHKLVNHGGRYITKDAQIELSTTF
jgi:hypothetical protein